MVSVRVPVHWLHCFTSTWWMLQPVTGTSSRGRCSRTSPPSGPTEHRWSIRCGSCGTTRRASSNSPTRSAAETTNTFGANRGLPWTSPIPDDPYRYMQIRGVVEAIEDDPTGAFYQVLQLRYRGTVGEVSDREFRVIVTIRPTGFKVR